MFVATALEQLLRLLSNEKQSQGMQELAGNESQQILLDTPCNPLATVVDAVDRARKERKIFIFSFPYSRQTKLRSDLREVPTW